MRRMRMAAGILFAGLCLWGCGQGGAGAVTDTGEPRAVIEVNKDGSISETIQEGFEAEYYDEEELRNMVLSEVAEFNRSYQPENIQIEKLENEKGMITMELKYSSARAYTAFNTDEYNEKTLFSGTVAEAYEAGYSLDVSMTDPQGEKGIGKEGLLSMGEARILIADQPVRVKLPGKIQYIGEHVTPAGKDKADMQADENGEALGMYYVVYE